MTAIKKSEAIPDSGFPLDNLRRVLVRHFGLRRSRFRKISGLRSSDIQAPGVIVEETVNVKRTTAIVASIVLLQSGLVGAADVGDKSAAAPCLIAGWENPSSVCAAHTKSIAATCFICHGPNGRSETAIPGLAGQDKAYLIAAMKDFRDGKRESTVMRKYALGYTDREYEDIATFFAAIRYPAMAEAESTPAKAARP